MEIFILFIIHKKELVKMVNHFNYINIEVWFQMQMPY